MANNRGPSTVDRGLISKRRAWISAFRLHTLPLALCCILLGNAIALAEGKFNIIIFLLGFLTAILLQVLSNVANDCLKT